MSFLGVIWFCIFIHVGCAVSICPNKGEWCSWDNCCGTLKCFHNNCLDCSPFMNCVTTNDCCYANICDQGKCEPCIKDHSPTKCSSNGDCCSGICGANGICASCSFFGNFCTDDYKCCKGLRCTDLNCISCAAYDNACTFPQDCCSGVCRRGRCTRCHPTGHDCTAYNDCCSRLCMRNKCVRCLSYNQPCYKYSQCCSGVCYGIRHDKRCYCSTIVGQRCLIDKDCCPPLKCYQLAIFDFKVCDNPI